MGKATFKKKRSWNVVCLTCGLLLIGLYIFIWHKDSEATMRHLLLGISFGAFFCAIGMVFLFWNRNAHLYINENGDIKGKFHFFSKVDCHLSDVTFAMGRNGTLMLQLKNGKCHTIAGVENALQLAFVIRKNMNLDTSEQADVLIEKQGHLKIARKKDMLRVCIGSALLFVNIFVAVLLTGGREMHEFSKTDWSVFAIMGAIELATIVTIFYWAQKAGKNQMPIEKLQYDIRRIIIETTPLLSGFVIAVYTDYDCYKRVTVFGYPHQSVVFCAVEKLDTNYNLVHTFTSEKYEDPKEVFQALEGLIDITQKAR